MLSFDDPEFGDNLLQRARQLVIWPTLSAMQNENPFGKYSLTQRIFRVEHHRQSPLATGILAPSVGGHEWPFREASGRIIVFRAMTENHGCRFHGTREEHRYIASSTGLHRHERLDMLQIIHSVSGV